MNVFRKDNEEYDGFLTIPTTEISLVTAGGGKVFASWPRGGAPKTDGLPPSKVAEIIRDQLNKGGSSYEREADLVVLAFIIEYKEIFDNQWAKRQIAALVRMINDLEEEIADLRQYLVD
jgi:hypothetical protein